MTNRRSFLKQASLTSAPFILPSHIWSAKGDESPNSRINVGIIGTGKMGRGHAYKLVRNPRTQVTGFAEIAEVRTQHTKELIEKHYSKYTPSGTWRGLTITKDYLELLEDKSLDAVLIATPDHWHGEPTIRAARAKKHVYCEKPISLTIKEGRAMADTVKENKVVFQTGSQQSTEYGGQISPHRGTGSQRCHRGTQASPSMCGHLPRALRSAHRTRARGYRLGCLARPSTQKGIQQDSLPR